VKQVSFTIGSSLSASTSASYSKTLAQYTQFLSRFSTSTATPLNAGYVLLFLAQLQLQSLATSTIVSKLSALNHFQKLSGFQDISTHFLVKKFISGIIKLNPSSDLRIPITLSVLNQLHFALLKVNTTFFAVLYQAIHALAFFAFLRPGEFTASPNNLLFQNLTLTSQSLSITFQSFKHHTGPPVVLSVSAQSTTPCPVRAMYAYIKVRGSLPGPLFCNT